MRVTCWPSLSALRSRLPQEKDLPGAPLCNRRVRGLDEGEMFLDGPLHLTSFASVRRRISPLNVPPAFLFACRLTPDAD